MIAGWTMGFAALYPSYGSCCRCRSGGSRELFARSPRIAGPRDRRHRLAYPSSMAAANAHRETEIPVDDTTRLRAWRARSEEHTSELQSLMRLSYAVFCLKKKQKKARSLDQK